MIECTHVHEYTAPNVLVQLASAVEHELSIHTNILHALYSIKGSGVTQLPSVKCFLIEGCLGLHLTCGISFTHVHLTDQRRSRVTLIYTDTHDRQCDVQGAHV
jgi:hypothetical protein